MTLYFVSGKASTLIRTSAEEHYAPTSFQHKIEFDPDTNAQLVAALDADFYGVSWDGTNVKFRGQTITVQGDGSEFYRGRLLKFVAMDPQQVTLAIAVQALQAVAKVVLKKLL